MVLLSRLWLGHATWYDGQELADFIRGERNCREAKRVSFCFHNV